MTQTRQFWTIEACLDVLADPDVTRRMMAVAYAELLRDWAEQGQPDWDWNSINTPIRRHWSLSGLAWIKKEAWMMCRGK